ncbi:ubiquinone biosynthesis protein UbiH, partial [Nitrosococcus oceani C-27]
LPELAFIAENRQLQTTIWHMLESSKENIRIYCPAKWTAITWHDTHVDVELTDGTELEAALIIGADGVNSWVRKQAGIDVSQHAYDQVGVVANFSTELSHRQIAHQWFRRDGVLALLPL